MAGRRGGGAVHAQSGGHRGRAQKNRRLYRGGRLDTPYAETASHLYFANSAYDPLFNFQSTTATGQTVLAIDPAFDGQFPHINALPGKPMLRRRRTIRRLYEENVRRAREAAKARGELK